MFKIIFATPESENYNSVRKIRDEVFIKEQGIEPSMEYDLYDEYGAPSTSAVLIENKVPAATGRLFISNGEYRISRIAVLKDFRKKGYGEAVVKTLLTKAFSMGATKVYVNSQLHAVGFYERIGFKNLNEPVVDRGKENTKMVIRDDDQISCGGCHEK